MSQGQRRAAVSPVVYIMSRFPLITETFILREMLELERQGLSPLIFPLLRMRPEVRHAEVELLTPRVHYTPFLSARIIAANVGFLRRRPRRYLRALRSALAGNLGSANLFAGGLGIFPKSVYFARQVEERGVRHVHAHFATHPALSALVISELTGVGFSFTAHAHDIFVHKRMLAEKLEKARFVVTISEFNKEYLLRLAPRVAPDKIKVIRCGIEPEKYGASGKAAAPDAGGVRELTLLCVASLRPYKGIKHLVRACALLRERVGPFRCLVVGEGKDRAELESLIAESGLQDVVRLLGARPQDEVAALLAESDLFVLPSVVAPDGQMEGVPVALMEAMASRLPVVSTRISGIPELVEEGVSGLLVPPADEAALADAIAALCLDADLRRRMGKRGRQQVEAHFDLKGNVARLRALFEEAIGGGPPAHAPHGVAESRDSSRVDPEVFAWLKARAPQLLGKGDGADDVRVRLDRLGGGRDSEVYELALENGSADVHSLILKLHRPSWAGAAEAVERGRRHAAVEFEALTKLWGEFSRRSATLGVPRPLGHLPERAALITEKCPGVKLDDELRWARFRAGSVARLAERVRGCGEWLALFHQVTRHDGDPASVFERVEREFYAELDACRERGLPERLAAAVARRFEAGKGAALSGGRLVGRHCDFAPYNVLVSEDKVTVIDLEGLGEGLPYDDLCYFLGMVEAMPSYHLGEGARRALRAGFLEGYSRRAAYDPALLDFFMLTTMVKIMAHSPVLRAAPGWRASLKRRQRLGFFTRWFGERVR